MSALPVIGATAMVYGFDMTENLRRLSRQVRHAELLLYWTPRENNFPNAGKVAEWRHLACELDLSLSVHLPSMLDLITGAKAARRKKLDLLCGLIQRLEPLEPTGYVLHLGPHAPRLALNPAAYLPAGTRCDLAYWYATGLAALDALQSALALGPRLLLENLNFSPLLLRPFLASGLGGLCFDAGHAWLGGENLTKVFTPLFDYVGEIHLHGIKGSQEHLSLAALESGRLKSFMELILGLNYTKLLNLEVFTPEDLASSLACLKLPAKGRFSTAPKLAAAEKTAGEFAG